MSEPMTLTQIEQALRERGKNEEADRLAHVSREHRDTVLDQAQYWASIGRMSRLDFDCYAYLWRNMVQRYGSDLLSYQLED